ncbi:MAG: polysaccharide deacetylase family protein [Sandaracinaceae bacterium]|nr:polysaccharide deacetylase family protein [Sandaracinaceae bacterium]
MVEPTMPSERPAPAPRPPARAAASREPVLPAPVEPEPMRPYARALRDGMVISGRTPHRLVLFTFDDGPDVRNTPRLLDELDRVGVKAVFFLTASRIAGRGPWERRNQEIARDILRRGHIVGNHTVDHAQLPLLDEAGVIAQVEGADAVFTRVLGERTWLLRPPGGARSARVDALLAGAGYTQVLWNLGTGDFQVRSAEDVFRTFRRVLERRERENGDRGGIVLMHDTHEWSVQAFPMMMSWLREQNCELLERGEELYDVVDDPALFFAPRAGASPSAEAPMSTASRAMIAERQRILREETARRCGRVAQR